MKIATGRFVAVLAAAIAGMVAGATSARAAPDGSDAAPFKLTMGTYQFSGGGLESGWGLDVNLRYTQDDANIWLGWFRSPVLGFSQWRGGWDDRIAVGPVTFVPSFQAASGGFFGGSAALETGKTWFAGAGLGRTNLKTYANLNFDPNDAWFVYAGHRWDAGNSIQLQLIRDNRENPDQQHVHVVWRRLLAGGDRLTVDLLFKQGTVESRYVRRTGLSVGYDWARWFVRLAWDPLVNFNPQDMVRIQFGSRF
jgi:hypothetical protein